MKNMTDESKFESMRPYRDEEIPAAMQRIADSTFFPLLASYVFPESDLATVKEAVKAIRTTDQFQAQVMYHVNAQVIRRTMTEFTYGGIGHLSPSERYLFIGNHRDIVLDSSLMQYVLFQNGHETSEITFGANLMQNQLIIDIGKANKMFKVERPGTDMRQFYQSSLRLSEYIRHTICHKHRSVWIAQRNGRTKDGKDSTDQGIIKMLGMSGGRNKADAIARRRHPHGIRPSQRTRTHGVLRTFEGRRTGGNRPVRARRLQPRRGQPDRPAHLQGIPPFPQQLHRPRHAVRETGVCRPVHPGARSRVRKQVEDIGTIWGKLRHGHPVRHLDGDIRKPR